jgi:hypothetical protein
MNKLRNKNGLQQRIQNIAITGFPRDLCVFAKSAKFLNLAFSKIKRKREI